MIQVILWSGYSNIPRDSSTNRQTLNKLVYFRSLHVVSFPYLCYDILFFVFYDKVFLLCKLISLVCSLVPGLQVYELWISVNAIEKLCPFKTRHGGQSIGNSVCDKRKPQDSVVLHGGGWVSFEDADTVNTTPVCESLETHQPLSLARVIIHIAQCVCMYVYIVHVRTVCMYVQCGVIVEN